LFAGQIWIIWALSFLHHFPKTPLSPLPFDVENGGWCVFVYSRLTETAHQFISQHDNGLSRLCGWKVPHHKVVKAKILIELFPMNHHPG
jgi:hypothetical protein